MAATPILMIPGLNATWRAFEPELDTLYRFAGVMIADHKQGKSMAEIARFILKDAPERFILGGFSMGGYIAFEVLRQARERVEKLILIDTSARPDTPEASEKRKTAIDLTQAGKFDLAVANAFANAVHPANVGRADLKSIHVGMARANGPEVYVNHQQAIMARPDSRPDLGTIDISTLIVVGDSDQVTPPDAAREMADGISDARLVVIRKAGHMALLEESGQVSEALRSFLAVT